MLRLADMVRPTIAQRETPTIDRLMDKPIPIPCVFVVKKG